MPLKCNDIVSPNDSKFTWYDIVFGHILIKTATAMPLTIETETTMNGKWNATRVVYLFYLEMIKAALGSGNAGYLWVL